MTTDLAQKSRELTPDEADRMTVSWPALLNTQIPNAETAERIRGKVARLSAPAPQTFIAAQVMILLSQYYVSSLPEAVQRETAALWGDELKGYPAWAIRKAVQWWLSEQNPKCDKKPVPGNISARCKAEMGVVKVGEYALRRFDKQTGFRKGAE